MADFDPEQDEASWKEWDAFLASHVRYEDTSQNFSLLAEFFAEHGLVDFNRDALHLAYTTLGDTLDLTPFATPLPAPVVEQSPAPAPAQPPAPVPTTPVPTRPSMTAWRNGKQIIVEPARPL